MLTPISIRCAFDDSLEITVSLPFFDVSFRERNNNKPKRRKKTNLKRATRKLKALKHSLDILLRNSRLSVFKESCGNVSEQSFITKAKRAIFSVFVSYLASKSGILITNEGDSDASRAKRQNTLFALIETRIAYVFIALVSFTVIRIFPKKEYGIVR